MKVAHLIWSAHFGGIERLTLDLCSAQVRLGLQPTVCLGKASGEFLPSFESAGIPTHTFGLGSGYDLHPGKRRDARRFLRPMDILHVHTYSTPLAWITLGQPHRTLYTEHGAFGLGRKLRTADHIKRFLYRHYLRHSVGHLAFNSEFTEQFWLNLCPVPGLPRSVVPNGLAPQAFDTNDILPAQDLRTRLEGKFVVGTSSRFAQFKRIDRLIQAFAIFARHHDARLLLVGDGPLRTQLESLVASLGIEAKTLFAGFRSDVRACQKCMDVCVFPSQSEPFGLAAVETLALGKPTLAFHDGGGMTDIIRSISPDNVVHDVEQLASLLSRYHDQPELASRHAPSLALAARRYDIDVTAKHYLHLYQSLKAP